VPKILYLKDTIVESALYETQAIFHSAFVGIDLTVTANPELMSQAMTGLSYMWLRDGRMASGGGSHGGGRDGDVKLSTVE
jgi:hypothetical protein